MSEILETERLLLRPLTIADAEEMFKNWANDLKVTKYLTWDPHKNVSETEEVINMWLQETENNKEFCHWGIVLKSENALIGSIESKSNSGTDKAEIGYCIGTKWWGKGIMTEALKEVIAYISKTYPEKEIWARHDIENPASGKVMRKAGMIFDREDGDVVKGRPIKINWYVFLN